MNGHGKGSLPSIEIGQVWSYCRDNLRGTTPLAQEIIDCQKRDFQEPSKAHIKRIHRHRPFVLKPRPPVPADTTARKCFNSAAKLGAEVKALHLRPAKREPVKYDFTRNATVPPSDKVGSVDFYEEQLARMQREFDDERARVAASLVRGK